MAGKHDEIVSKNTLVIPAKLTAVTVMMITDLTYTWTLYINLCTLSVLI